MLQTLPAPYSAIAWLQQPFYAQLRATKKENQMATARQLASDPERIPIELPLPKFVEWAVERNQAHYDAQRKKGLFVTPLFEFVRYLKAHPTLEKLTAMEAFEHLRALPWRDLFPESTDPQIEFLDAWDKVRVPGGQDILIYAAGLARDKPIRLRKSISEKYSQFVSIAAHLQSIRPGDYINLPVVRLADILKVDLRTVSYYTHRAMTDGFLTRLAKHHALSHQAARYTFDCERFDMETGEEITAEDRPHFHKGHKGSKDSEDLKESHDERETSRAKEEPERQTGSLGLLKDFERQVGKSGAQFPGKNGDTDFAERRKEQKEQARFLESKKTRN